MTKNLTIFNSIFHKASGNRKLYVFLFCLLLSTFFWLLNALSKNFTTDVDFKVSYSNFPQNKVIINELPKKFKLKIKGLGFDLMTYKLSIKKPTLIINLSKIQHFHQQTTSIKYTTLSSSSFSPFLSSQLGNQIEIKDIYPDSIHFLFDERKEKMVEIIPITELNFEKQYQLFGEMLVKPAFIKVSGPASIIDTLKVVYTDSIFIENLTETTTKTVSINKIYDYYQLTFKPNNISLRIPVEKLTETTIMVNVDYINVPDSIKMKAIPNEIELKFMIPLSKMSSLSTAIFRAEIDYQQISNQFNHKLKVDVVKYPNYIQSLTLNPEKVEYILKKQN